MRIAIVGTRGIPPRYGGFETMAWELSRRLVARGHDVTVYCRRGRVDEAQSVPRGVRRVFLPFLGGKHLETVTHSALSMVDAMRKRYDVVLLVNVANAFLAALPRLVGAEVVLNVDGIERQRAKWGLAGRTWYLVGERLALVMPDMIVADAEVIRRYYLERYRKPSVLIAYGATVLPRSPAPDLTPLGIDGISGDDYFLYVSRLEPENQALMVVEAYRDVPGSHPLLIVGDAPYASEYKARVRQAAQEDPRVRLVGGVYGAGYRDLQRGAMAYIQATSVGGTHPALIESMAARNLVLVFATPENEEVAGGASLSFRDPAELAELMTRVAEAPFAPELDELRAAALARAVDRYSWDAVASQYESLFERLVGSPR